MSNRQALGQALKCFAEPHKRQDYFNFYSDDIVLHGYQGVGPGLNNVKQFYNAFWEVFPDAQVTAQEFIEEGDTLVVRYVITGTQKKAFMGVNPADSESNSPASVFFISEMADVLNDGPAQTHCCC